MSLDPNVMRLHHYHFRYGLRSFEERVERGYVGKGGSVYEGLNASKGDPWLINATRDATLVGTSDVLEGLMTAVPSSERKSFTTKCSFIT